MISIGVQVVSSVDTAIQGEQLRDNYDEVCVDSDEEMSERLKPGKRSLQEMFLAHYLG